MLSAAGDLRAALSRALHPAVPDCGDRAPAAFTDPAYAAGAQSPDEAAIVDALATRVRPGDRLLHAGIGSSKLAARLVPLGVHVDGLTLSPAELDAARALGLPGYVVALLDKHRLAPGDVPGPYAWIVDNNPGGYACCRRHFDAWLDACAARLGPGGALVTHRRGAGWRRKGGVALPHRAWMREVERRGLLPSTLADVWLATRPS